MMSGWQRCIGNLTQFEYAVLVERHNLRQPWVFELVAMIMRPYGVHENPGRVIEF